MSSESAVTATTEEMIRWIEEIVSFGIRRPGWPADVETEDYLETKFKEFGLEEIHREPVPTNRWIPSKTALSIGSEKESVECIAVPYTAWTEAEGVEAPLVYIGDGTDLPNLDVAGKIVVMDARFGDFSGEALKANASDWFDPDSNIPDGVIHKANWLIMNFPLYYMAQKKGAVGFVGLLVDSPIDGSAYWVPYDGFLKDLPALWVGRELADSVRAKAEASETATLTSCGETTKVDTHNVVGVVPGKSKESILLTCHHDAPWDSAVEDASGLSLLLALAKTFGARKRELDRTLIFVAASGHFHGGIGNRVFVNSHRDGLLKSTVATFGMEHVAHEAEEDGQGGYRLTGLPEVRALFVQGDRLRERIGEGIRKWGMARSLIVDPYMFGPEPPCDSAPYFTAGVPSFNLISGPLYLFDDQDTIDKVRAEELVPVASFFAELIESLESLTAAELEEGLTRGRDDPPADPPHWFLPPAVFLGKG